MVPAATGQPESEYGAGRWAAAGPTTAKSFLGRRELRVGMCDLFTDLGIAAFFIHWRKHLERSTATAAP